MFSGRREAVLPPLSVGRLPDLRYAGIKKACRWEGMDTPATWLCPTELDRERLLDMERRLKPVRAAAFGVLVVALLVTAPRMGWWTLAPFAAAVAAYAIADFRLERRKRPEYWVGAAWLFVQIMIGLSIWKTGGPDSPAVAWLAIPAVTLASSFSARGMTVGLLFTAAILIAATTGTDPMQVAEHPQQLMFPLALLLSVTVLSSALMVSDRAHRADAVLDPLTGLLNRSALDQRFEELAQQARLNGEWVGVIVGDLDHFKAINDEHGHVQGDAVLKDVAYTMRKSMRAFDLIYRLGGEEFMVLLPGANLDQARHVAERLRQSVVDARPGGINVSMSLGVSASTGGKLNLERLFGLADAALYDAKRAGRNRVIYRAAEPMASKAPPTGRARTPVTA
jgi:diguanylate cyclase (GGDEF)-like protein